MGRVVSNFIVQAITGQDITIYGDGSQTRSFGYVDDLIVGMMAMMNGPDSFVGPVNIGNPNEFTMLDLAKLVIELTGAKAKIVSSSPARRRPQSAPAGHHAGQEIPELGAQGPVAGRFDQDH